MRIWHPSLLQELPGSKLGTLHMSLCRIRQNPWGRPTARTWYYNLSWDALAWYHSVVIREMQGRGWRVDIRWLDYTYRGKSEPLPRRSGDTDYESNHLSELEAISPETARQQRELLHSVTSLAIIERRRQNDITTV